jgi:3-oxoacyl-[acyl-carrier protein] reductase
MIACQMTEPSQSLAGRTMFVTGASSGIGKAIALAAARAGADVAFTYRTNETGARDVQQAITALGRRAAVIRLDVSNDASLRALGPAVRAALGRVDAWVNNAGADILTGPAASLSDSQRLDLLLAVDLRGTIHASWCAAEVLAEQEAGGVIINMSWDHVLSGMAGTDPQMFAAVKGGVLAFSKSLAGLRRHSAKVSMRSVIARLPRPRRSNDGARRTTSLVQPFFSPHRRRRSSLARPFWSAVVW